MYFTLSRLVKLSLVFLFSFQLNAQAAILAAIFGDKVASEKFNLSLELGFNWSDYASVSNSERKMAVNFGIAGNIKLSEKFYLSPSAYFLSNRTVALSGLSLNTGNLALDGQFQNTSAELNLSYIDVPIIAWYAMDDWRLGIAPQISFRTGAELEYKGSEGKFTKDIKSQVNNLDYGMMFLISYELGKARKGKGLFIQARYYLGFADVIDDNLQFGSGKNRNDYFALHIAFPFITEELAKKKLDKYNE